MPVPRIKKARAGFVFCSVKMQTRRVLFLCQIYFRVLYENLRSFLFFFNCLRICGVQLRSVFVAQFAFKLKARLVFWHKAFGAYAYRRKGQGLSCNAVNF